MKAQIFVTDDIGMLFFLRFIQINSLSFSTDDMYLISSSSTETVHVFRLVDPPQEKYVTEQNTKSLRQLFSCARSSDDHQGGWMSYLGKALATPASMLPAQVSWWEWLKRNVGGVAQCSSFGSTM